MQPRDLKLLYDVFCKQAESVNKTALEVTYANCLYVTVSCVVRYVCTVLVCRKIFVHVVVHNQYPVLSFMLTCFWNTQNVIFSCLSFLLLDFPFKNPSSDKSLQSNNFCCPLLCLEKPYRGNGRFKEHVNSSTHINSAIIPHSFLQSNTKSSSSKLY